MAACRVLLTACSVLHAACCILQAMCFLQMAGHCVLPTAACLMFVAACSLHVRHILSSVACCLPLRAHCLLPARMEVALRRPFQRSTLRPWHLCLCQDLVSLPSPIPHPRRVRRDIQGNNSCCPHLYRGQRRTLLCRQHAGMWVGPGAALCGPRLPTYLHALRGEGRLQPLGPLALRHSNVSRWKCSARGAWVGSQP